MLNCDSGHLGFSILKHFLCTDIVGLFIMHFRHGNKHKSAAKSSPAILFNPCSDFSINVIIMWVFAIFGSHFYSLFNEIISKMCFIIFIFPLPVRKKVLHISLYFLVLGKNSVFDFLNCDGGHLAFSISGHFLCTDCVELFLLYFRHANEHKSAEKPSLTILLNLSTLLTGLYGLLTTLISYMTDIWLRIL